MLALYHHGSSVCAAKVRFALGEKRLEWQSHYVDILAGEQFRPEFLAINPKAVVPVLIAEGAVITESTVICEYLEDAFPDIPLYPRSPLERARVRLWTKAVDEELHPACSAITYVVSHRHTILRNGARSFDDFVRNGSHEGASARALKWQWIQHGLEAPGVADRIRLYVDYLERMERSLQKSAWLVGEQFTMADVAVAPYLNRLEALSMAGLWQRGRLPRLANWFERVRARAAFAPAFLSWMPPELGLDMRMNGEKSWPHIAKLLDIQESSTTD